MLCERWIRRSPVHQRPDVHIHTYRQFKVSNQPHLHVLDYGRKQNHKGIHTAWGGECKLHTDRIKPGTFSL